MPPDVQQVSDLLVRVPTKSGLRPDVSGIARTFITMLTEGQRPSAHQAAEPLISFQSERQ